jgi:prepilin-type processing-associated H-X9-DG protein
VVISIIALLLSILLPALGKAKAAAQSVVCLSGLKQASYVSITFASENKDKLQHHWWAKDSDGVMFHTKSNAEPELKRKIMWMYAAEGYYQDPKFMLCPSAPKTLNPPESGVAQFGDVKHAWFAGWGPNLKGTNFPAMSSLVFNDWLGSEGPTPYEANTVFGKNLFLTTNQSQSGKIPMLLDGSWYHTTPELHFPAPADDPLKFPEKAYKHATGNWFSDVCMPRHQKRTQVVFLDGSAQKIGLRSLWELRWHKNWTYGQTVPGKNPNYRWPEWIESLPE